jgi:uncharacterized protein (DUF302 family)/enamine deaminase RidA (YjgF/YER057c/UK114 family)
VSTEITRINPETLHPTPGYHHLTVMEARRTVFLAGQCPLGRDGEVVGQGDLDAQIDQVVSNVLGALQAVGAHPDDVVRSVIYVVSDDGAVLASAWHRLTRSAIGAAFTSASTLLGVAQLGFRGQLVEVELTAALPESAGETMSPSSPAGGESVITKDSPRSVADTVARLSEIVEAKGLKLFAVVDHSGEAAKAGLELRDTKLVVFGSPAAGTPVMHSVPLAALDLPLKALIWDDEGQTKVSYTAPPALAARYRLGPELAARLAGIDALTDAVVAGEPG